MTIAKISLVCAVALLLLSGCGYDLGLDRRITEAKSPAPDPRYNVMPKKERPPHFALEYQKKFALPPAQYYHDYDGRLDLRRADGTKMNELCANVRQHGGQVLGCSFVMSSKQCMVYILNDDELDLAGWDYDVIWRHERGHCNGGHHDAAGHWH